MLPLLAAVLLATATQPPASARSVQPTADPPAKASASFPVEYVAPENPAHARIYAAAREQRVLEVLSHYLGLIDMPRPLKLRLAGCQGESNAWYDPDDRSATFCYEYISELVRNVPAAGEKSFALDDAVLGQFTFVYLHEIGHALFDILKVPVLGREEDAADRFAAFVLLQSGDCAARQTLRGTAWALYHDGKAHKPDESDFADVHSLDAQRYYDLLCLAYGSDPLPDRGTTEKSGLPRDRAEVCADEWRQADFGFRTVLAKYLDPERFPQLRDEQLRNPRHTLLPAGAPGAEEQAKPSRALSPDVSAAGRAAPGTRRARSER